jgi:hypothetical protein
MVDDHCFSPDKNMIHLLLFREACIKLANGDLVVNKKEPPGDGWRLFLAEGDEGGLLSKQKALFELDSPSPESSSN